MCQQVLTDMSCTLETTQPHRSSSILYLCSYPVDVYATSVSAVAHLLLERLHLQQCACGPVALQLLPPQQPGTLHS
jgi:hypothetical protein